MRARRVPAFSFYTPSCFKTYFSFSMKNGFLFTLVLAVLGLSACDKKGGSGEFEDFGKGVRAKFHNSSSADAARAAEGQLLGVMQMVYNSKDSLLQSTYDKKPITPDPINAQSPLGDSLFNRLAVGDSVTVLLAADSMFAGGRPMPPFIEKGSDLRFEIKVEGVYSQKELQAKITEARETFEAQVRDEDEAKLQKYIQEAGINAEKTENGVYYAIETQGDTSVMAQGSHLVMHYTARVLEMDTAFMDTHKEGELFDKIILGQEGRFLPGFQGLLQRFGKGGKGKIILPSLEAYGGKSFGETLPAYSSLVVEIEIVDVYTQEAWQKYLDDKKKAQVNADAEKIQKYLADNNITAQKTESGIYYEVQTAGEPNSIQPGMEVSVHYTGTLLDGTKFDSSHDRGEPIAFPIGQGRVIKGWDEGIPLFGKGGKGRLFIPSSLAYGERARPSIPANSILIFEVEVVDAK